MNVKKAFRMWCMMTILFAFCILGSELFVLNKGGSWCNTKVSTLQPSGHGFKIAETTSLLAGVRLRTTKPLDPCSGGSLMHWVVLF